MRSFTAYSLIPFLEQNVLLQNEGLNQGLVPARTGTGNAQKERKGNFQNASGSREQGTQIEEINHHHLFGWEVTNTKEDQELGICS